MSGVETTCSGLVPMWTLFRGKNSVRPVRDMASSLHGANARRNTTGIDVNFGTNVPLTRTAVFREHVSTWGELRYLANSATAGSDGSDRDATKVRI